MPATRLEKARRAFVYTTDVAVVAITLSLVFRLAWAVTNEKVGLPLAVGAALCDVAVCALFSRLCRAAMRGTPTPTRELIVAALLAAGALALAPVGDAGGAALVWTAMVALYLSLRAVVVCGAAMVIVTTVYCDLTVANTPFWATLVYVALQVAAAIALMRVWLFLWRVLKDAHQGQEAKAVLAVSEERQRFARDLHDLLGHSLSVITVKCELATKLVEKDPQRATAEIVEARRLAKEALREVRTTVQGYRELDLEGELASVRAVLEAAGVRCDVSGDGRELLPATRTLLAWAIREGTTNILKHSTASYCSISISDGVLEMRNDGARDAADSTGTGLDGLSERVTVAGGSVSTTRGSGEFVLRAEVPT